MPAYLGHLFMMDILKSYFLTTYKGLRGFPNAVFESKFPPEDEHELEPRDGGIQFASPHSYNPEACSGIRSLYRWKGVTPIY